MTNLIARLRDEHVSASRTEAADRIEELVKERDKFREVFNTSSILLGETELQLEEAEAKLAKAVEALRDILSGVDIYPWRKAREVLVELEGKE